MRWRQEKAVTLP